MSSRRASSLPWSRPSSSATSISRSSPTRFSSSICRSSSSSGFSKSRVYALAIRSPHLDVADRVRAEETSERVDDLFARFDFEPPGAESHCLAVTVGPLNIDRGRTGVAGADRGGPLQQFRLRSPGGAPAERDPHRARPAELLQGPGRLHHEGRSEEHTSELQSRLHLVCRLLLE